MNVGSIKRSGGKCALCIRWDPGWLLVISDLILAILIYYYNVTVCLLQGMVKLGYISNVQDFELRVSLPGRLVGITPITNVSTPYTSALKVYT